MTSLAAVARQVDPDDLAGAVAGATDSGGRFTGLVATARDGGATSLRALIADGASVEIIEALLPAGVDHYRALTPVVPGAFWYEREIHDLFGLVADGHPRLDALVFPLTGDGGDRLRPGRPEAGVRVDPDTSALPGHVYGEGVFTIPYGPVRSGVFETVEYLVETFGEDIPQLRVRPYLKHRGIARRFTGLDPGDGVLLAERAEGTMSAAHAIAFCGAIETLGGVDPPPAAQLLRVVHAELERIAHHLDSMIRHTEGAGQAVAYARLSWHKERLLRLQADLCGHRFARGVVTLGGTTGPPLLAPDEALGALRAIEADLARDLRTLMTTPSFLDRLRTTGIVAPAVAVVHGALGPVGRGSGTGPDVRIERPYGGYRQLGFAPAGPRDAGDALARQWIRAEEVAGSWHLLRQALDELGAHPDGPWRCPAPVADGTGLGWSESPQGELIYLVEVTDGHLAHVKARTASFHNFALFSHAFGGDILTDFVFIEASFGVNLAGVAG
ncbi:MAG TPA: NADH-quinone oxidoreductase subunit C [Acidimicrobiales bacterium]|jgi:Ni,Fe-hydrogenase III large subunit|nr:NADH-quinone oxidoreductase subunit C [Acidimicrobiales bacterium]